MLSTRSHSYETRVRSLSLIARDWGWCVGGERWETVTR